MLAACVYINSENKAVCGYKLEGHDVMQENDVYMRMNGRWEKCGRNFAGMRVGEGCPSLIVRPLPVREGDRHAGTSNS